MGGLLKVQNFKPFASVPKHRFPFISGVKTNKDKSPLLTPPGNTRGSDRLTGTTHSSTMSRIPQARSTKRRRKRNSSRLRGKQALPSGRRETSITLTIALDESRQINVRRHGEELQL
jgi:hypothetical protein